MNNSIRFFHFDSCQWVAVFILHEKKYTRGVTPKISFICRRSDRMMRSVWNQRQTNSRWFWMDGTPKYFARIRWKQLNLPLKNCSKFFESRNKIHIFLSVVFPLNTFDIGIMAVEFKTEASTWHQWKEQRTTISGTVKRNVYINWTNTTTVGRYEATTHTSIKEKRDTLSIARTQQVGHLLSTTFMNLILMCHRVAHREIELSDNVIR